REETEFKPKPMVDIGDRPILWHIMKHYAHHGFDHFILCLGYKGDVIRDYFPGGRFEHGTVHALDTGSDTMTGGRVLLAAEHTRPGPMMVTYGDAVADVDLGALLALHRAQGRIGTVTAVHPTSPFGELQVDGALATAWHEKPRRHDAWVNGGY